MIEKHIVIEDIDPVMLYGVNNANIQMIKALYPKLRIAARGNVMHVMGDEPCGIDDCAEHGKEENHEPIAECPAFHP